VNNTRSYRRDARPHDEGGSVKLTNPERLALGGWVTIFIGLVWLVIVLAASLFTAVGDAQPDGIVLTRQLVGGVIAISLGFAALGLAKWLER
jgi:hypothetical protein